MLIFDSAGNPLRRAIGFIGGFAPVRKAQALIGSLYVVGVEVPLIEDDEEDDEDDDAARTRERMRRAA